VYIADLWFFFMISPISLYGLCYITMICSFWWKTPNHKPYECMDGGGL